MESDRTRVLKTAQNAELVHPGLPLVEAFLNDAVDGDQAARYLLHNYADGNVDPDFIRFVKDWKELVSFFSAKNPRSNNLSWTLKKLIVRRDGYQCCLTKVPCRFWNIWDVSNIIPPAAFSTREKLNEMLGAFTTPFHRDLLKGQSLENQARNCWTLCRDAAIAFSRGRIRLEQLEGTKYEILCAPIGGRSPAIYTLQRVINWKCNLADHTSSGIESPDPELLRIHSRFSKAIVWTNIAAKIDSRPCLRQSQNTFSSPFTKPIASAARAIWSKFPDSFRFQTYKILRQVGLYLYGPCSAAAGVQRLPFGMYLKYGPAGFHAKRHAREFNALKIVQNQTTIPIPYPIDLLLSSTESFLVTSRIEGGPVGLALDECSDEELQEMARDLRSWVAELRSIKRDTDSKYAITDATGGPCFDYRIGSDPVGPFCSEKEFSESLKLGALGNLSHRADHEIVFTHADLNLRNILVQDGKITRIVDWENAGWFPEYWEFTKCHFGVNFSNRWLKMWGGVFDHKYEEELAIERQYWVYNAW